MINVEALVNEQLPARSPASRWLRRSLILLLRQLFREREFQEFERQYAHLRGFDFVDQVLDYFEFSWTLRDKERVRIPPSGRVVIIANHPIGSLDGLALLQLVRSVRPDVKVVANQLLQQLKPLESLLLPVDNMRGETSRENLRAIRQHLENEGAVILFPAGSVSRLGPAGVRDGRWKSGFLHYASATRSPILPVFVDGRNSGFFYSLSLVARPLSTMWLVREMFKQRRHCLNIRIGEPIPFSSYSRVNVTRAQRVRLFQRHLYRLAENRPGIFDTERSIAHPENRRQLRDEIRAAELLGETADGKEIRLCRWQPDSTLMRELGRLREHAFRTVGEGTGRQRDTDRFDPHYMHLVLWDDADLEVVGAYRLCDTAQTLAQSGPDGLYSAGLFDYRPEMAPCLEAGLELGRSFVQPAYWGRRSLDYLWYGIGALLRRHPHYRYLFGPVSLSGSYPERAKQMIVHYYRTHHGFADSPVTARNPYCIDSATQAELQALFPGVDRAAEFIQLKSQLSHMDCSVPTLFKQYADVAEPDGVRYADFSVDPAFNNCIDGFVIVDTTRLKPSRRDRYIGAMPVA